METIFYEKQVERWGTAEFTCRGPAEDNPFLEQTIKGIFSGKHETVEADGFYDGGGIYKVRFMPSFEGEYSFSLTGSFLDKTAEGSDRKSVV